MGEYAKYNGQSVKIGTCESMYYLRAEQARMVTAAAGSVDPVRDATRIRFRFPFPGEDSIAPGAFEDYEKRIAIPGMQAPAEIADEHYSVQFVAQSHGYNVCLPCPESGKSDHGLKVHRNGFAGAVFLSQQVLHEGTLAPVLSCVCGVAWRVPESDAGPLLEALEAAAQSDRHRKELSHRHWNDGADLPADWRSFYDELADRIRRGFDREYVATLFPLVAA